MYSSYFFFIFETTKRNLSTHPSTTTERVSFYAMFNKVALHSVAPRLTRETRGPVRTVRTDGESALAGCIPLGEPLVLKVKSASSVGNF